MKVVSFATAVAALAGAAYGFEPAEFENKLTELVQEEHEDAYYFEKHAFEGSWLPTVLIFGYPNNAGACDFILQAASTADPALRFRCRPVN